MKTKFLALLLIVAILPSFEVFAQSGPHKFGVVDDADVRMRVYDQDTSAAAIVLSDYGYTYFVPQHGLKLTYERHTRIKILKKTGYNWANVSVPYFQVNNSKEKITNLQGYTYNMEGGKVVKHKLDTDGMYDEKLSENWNLKKFTMPNVKEGSIIEYSYTVTSDFMYNLRGWEFQSTIPVLHSEYKVRIAEPFHYRLEQQGYLSFDVYEKAYKAGNLNYHWVIKNAPAMREEKFMTTLRDYQSRVDFELQSIKYPERPLVVVTGNWEQVTRELLAAERFGQQLSRKGFFKNEVAAIVAKHAVPEQQMEAVHNLVKTTMKWNNMHSFGSSGQIRKAYENRSGNSADINLLLIAMLRDAGLDAGPVLLSTRENGRVPTTPMLTKFNYVIAHVIIGDKEYLLDATDPLLPANMLPMHCLNGKGRLIKNEDQRWIALTPSSSDARLFSGELKISPDGGMTGKATESSSGYNALRLRKAILDEGEEKYAEKVSKDVGNYKLDKPTFTNVNDLAKTLSIGYTLKAMGSGHPSDVIYLNPMMGQGEKENPFKLESREYPVDLGVPIDHTYMCRFTLPEGYDIEEAPKNMIVTLPENGGKFMYVIEREGNAIQIVSKVSVLKPVYFAPDYPYLKEFYSQIVAKHAEQIVLKKIQ